MKLAVALRVDLDYVPWDTPDAEEFGHSEPAVVLRLLQWATTRKISLSFFCSTRVMRVFPSMVEKVEYEGHVAEWLCKHPQECTTRLEEAAEVFAACGAQPQGIGLKTVATLKEADWQQWPFRFGSGPVGTSIDGLPCFAVDGNTDRESYWANVPAYKWADQLKGMIRNRIASQNVLTIAIRPQVLAKYDPTLQHLDSLVEYVQVMDTPIVLLRDHPEVRMHDPTAL
ncbi:MAG: hypothetical protein ACK4P3_07090 [Fimbriimonadaceae bacterium]